MKYVEGEYFYSVASMSWAGKAVWVIMFGWGFFYSLVSDQEKWQCQRKHT